jgi:hypothetical protein
MLAVFIVLLDVQDDTLVVLDPTDLATAIPSTVFSKAIFTTHTSLPSSAIISPLKPSLCKALVCYCLLAN